MRAQAYAGRMMAMEAEGRLRTILRGLGGAVVAYSGGADSAYLAETSHRVLGARSWAVIADSPSIPRVELHGAVELAETRGWQLRVVQTDELGDERYSSNPTNRCFWCKTHLMDELTPIAKELQAPILLGTNVDDLGDHRPGQSAASERGALHPMVDAGLTKQEIRDLSRRMGLPTHDKPAAACLASRFAYGVRVTSEGLGRIEAAEAMLHARGYAVVRVRDLGDDRARIEVAPDAVKRLIDESGQVERDLSTLGFVEVAIDPRGYRQGSMNEAVLLGMPRIGAVEI